MKESDDELHKAWDAPAHPYQWDTALNDRVRVVGDPDDEDDDDDDEMDDFLTKKSGATDDGIKIAYGKVQEVAYAITADGIGPAIISEIPQCDCGAASVKDSPHTDWCKTRKEPS
jgi:hypothetical protein